MLALALKNDSEDDSRAALQEELKAQSNLDTVKEALLNADSPLLGEGSELDVAALLTANPDIAADLQQLTETLDLSLEEQVSLAIALNRIAFDRLSAPDDASRKIREIILEKQDLEEALQEEAKNEALAQDALHALLSSVQSLQNIGGVDLNNLTPQQFAALQTEIQQQITLEQTNAADDIGIGDLQAAVAQLLNIVNSPAGSLGELTALPASLNGGGSSANNADAALAQQLNALNVGGSGAESITGADYLTATASGEHGNGTLSDFELLVKNLGEKGEKSAPEQILTQLKKAAPEGLSSHTLPDLSALAAGGDGSFLTAALDGFDTYFENFSAGQSALNSLQAAANSVTQGQSAGQSHPATQLVAVTLQNLGQVGDDRVFTLRLDPAELGRVNVRLSFGQDNSVEARLVVERPETYGLLQRDAHALELSLIHI